MKASSFLMPLFNKYSSTKLSKTVMQTPINKLT